MSVYTEAFIKDKLIKELEAEHCEVIKVFKLYLIDKPISDIGLRSLRN